MMNHSTMRSDPLTKSDQKTWVTLTCLLLSLGIALMSTACNLEPGPQKIQFAIRAVDTNNMPVNGVYIYLSAYEGVWGATDTNGSFNAESEAIVGDTLSFRLEAPEG